MSLYSFVDKKEFENPVKQHYGFRDAVMDWIGYDLV